MAKKFLNLHIVKTKSGKLEECLEFLISGSLQKNSFLLTHSVEKIAQKGLIFREYLLTHLFALNKMSNMLWEEKANMKAQCLLHHFVLATKTGL